MGTTSTASVEATTGVNDVQVLLDFKTYPEKTFEPFINKVYQCSSTNPHKTVPPEILDDCLLKRDAYSKARTNRDANPSPANTQFLEAAQVAAANSFEVLAKWVQVNCDNDPAIALSFGFKIAKTTRTAATQYPKPSNVEYSYGMPGTVVFKCKSLGRNAKYFLEYSLDYGATWVQCGFSTKSFRIIANGLVRGKEYIFKLYGVNDAGQGLPYFSSGIIAAV